MFCFCLNCAGVQLLRDFSVEDVTGYCASNVTLQQNRNCFQMSSTSSYYHQTVKLSFGNCENACVTCTYFIACFNGFKSPYIKALILHFSLSFLTEISSRDLHD